MNLNPQKLNILISRSHVDESESLQGCYAWLVTDVTEGFAVQKGGSSRLLRNAGNFISEHFFIFQNTQMRMYCKRKCQLTWEMQNLIMTS